MEVCGHLGISTVLYFGWRRKWMNMCQAGIRLEFDFYKQQEAIVTWVTWHVTVLQRICQQGRKKLEWLEAEKTV